MAQIDALLSGRKIDEEMYEELEDLLIMHDVGVTAATNLLRDLRRLVKDRKILDGEGLRLLLKEIISNSLGEKKPLRLEPGTLNIFLVVGVNGVGKTTTIGKLAQRYKEQGLKVMVAAGDTFRAAASSQLEIWAERAGVYLVSHADGADPAAVVFDAVHSARAKKIDLLLVDTAGRLHNKSNLMQELGKIRRIIDREAEHSLREVLLVVDATTGQNALVQAKEFAQIVPVTGIVLTKLDGTAKGGIVIAINQEQKIPIKIIGVGEKISDLRDFDPQEFAEALFEK
ncbi:MAG: fused signal recognition particle receptor [Bacillota bacterium]|nr:MAG: fused signal recognition particle receptor [Bacillota bacterium]MBS3950743.1 signal recognition particle-docking protein FtsY [Peptococcaceae bacterium]